MLALLCLVPMTVGAFAADEEEKGFLVYPTVRIAGARWNLWNNYTDTENRTKIYDQDDGVPVSASFIAKKAAKLLPLFVNAMKTDDYDEYVPLTDKNAGSDPFRPTSFIRTKLDLLKAFAEMIFRRIKAFFGKFKIG